MTARQVSVLDRCLAEVDTALRVLAATAGAARPSPADPVSVGQISAPELSESERQTSVALMRVNHAGEVAAQALYRGQALLTRDPELRAALLEAARDEQDHLAWCERRVTRLGGRTSLLGPLWYAGSFGIGAAAGLAGRALGLGFVAETERQVEQHLSDHLDRLPVNDQPSRRIVTQIRADEIGHGAAARARGGAELPDAVRTAMRLVARIMTTLARRL